MSVGQFGVPGWSASGNGRGMAREIKIQCEGAIEYGMRSGTEEGNNNDGQVETGGEKSKMRPDPQL